MPWPSFKVKGFARGISPRRPNTALMMGTPSGNFSYALIMLPANSKWKGGKRLAAGDIDAQLFHFFGVVAAQQNIPLFAAFGDIAFLRANLGARSPVHFLLGHQDIGHLAYNLQTYRIGVLVSQPQF